MELDKQSRGRRWRRALRRAAAVGLAGALAFAQTLPHGVYVAMNGRAFDWNNVRKNRGSGRFEELRT